MSLPPPELTLEDRRESTEGSNPACSIKHGKRATSPGKCVAGQAPTSASPSPCLGKESTAATPSPLFDKEFKEGGAIAAAVMTGSVVPAGDMLHSQRRRADETQKERRSETEEECAEYNRQQLMHSRGRKQKGEKPKDRDEAVKEHAKQSIRQRIDEPRIGGREALEQNWGKPRADAKDTEVYLTLLEARKNLAKAKREDTHLHCRTGFHREECGEPTRTGFVCDTPSSATLECATPITSVTTDRAGAFPSGTPSWFPVYHGGKEMTGEPHKEDCSIAVPLCCDTRACYHFSASPRTSVYCIAHLPAKGEQQGTCGVTHMSQTDCTEVSRSGIRSASQRASPPAASNGVPGRCAHYNYNLGSFPDRVRPPRESVPLCTLVSRKTAPKGPVSPQGSPRDWKALTEKVNELNAGPAAGRDNAGSAGFQSYAANTLQRSCDSTYEGNGSLRPSTAAITCMATTEARSRTYDVRALLAARNAVEDVQGAAYAEEAFHKVQRELQSRYQLLERCEERVLTTSAPEQQQKIDGNSPKPGLLPSGGIFPLFTAGHPPNASLWTDPIHPTRTTSKPPPPPPPPPHCLSQLQARPIANPGLRGRESGNLSIASPVSTEDVRGSRPSTVESTPLAPAASTSCPSIYSNIGFIPDSGTGRRGGPVESSNKECGKRRTSLNPQAPAFRPQGPSLLLRLLSNAAEQRPVQSHPTSRLYCPREAINLCNRGDASAFKGAETRGADAVGLSMEELCCLGRNSGTRFLSDAIARAAQKCVLSTLLPGRISEDSSVVFPREVLLPHLLRRRAEPQSQQHSLSFQPTCQKQLQQFPKTAALQSPLHCPSRVNTREAEKEIPHSLNTQHHEQPTLHQIDRDKQHEGYQQVQGCRTPPKTKICPSEPRMPAEALSNGYTHARDEPLNTSCAFEFDKNFRQIPRKQRESRDSSISRNRAPKARYPQDDRMNKNFVPVACMRSAEQSNSFSTVASASSRLPALFRHLQGQQHVGPADASLRMVVSGGVPKMTSPIYSAIARFEPLNTLPTILATRSMCSKGAGLDEGLAEVVDPLIANKMLLQLGKTLRLTHLKVLNVVRRASVAGVPLRLTDLPAAFLKEHNAVLDLRSLGLLHIREVIAGMGRSLLLLRKHPHQNRWSEEQLPFYGKTIQQGPDDGCRSVDVEHDTSEAFQLHGTCATAEHIACPLGQFPKNRTSSTEQSTSAGTKTLHDNDSTRCRAGRDCGESGNGRGSDVRLRRFNGADLCFTAAKELTSLGKKLFPGKLTVEQKDTYQYREAPTKATDGTQHSEATVDGSVQGRASCDALEPNSLSALENEGDLLLLEGDPLPSVMKELLQHLLVSLVADALHHRSPPETTEGTCRPTETRSNYSKDVFSSKARHSVFRCDHRESEEYIHQAEKTERCSHGDNDSATKQYLAALPCTFLTQSALVAPLKRGSPCKCGGLDPLEWSQRRGGGEEHTRIRGLLLQLLPTLWQLKYGVRCNLPAMLETCGYASVKHFIFDALPCLRFSPSGTHVALRLSDTYTGCPGIMRTVMCRLTEKHVFTHQVQTKKTEHSPDDIKAEELPEREAAVVASETVTRQDKNSPGEGIPAVPSLEVSNKAAASGRKEQVNTGMRESPPFTKAVFRTQAQGLFAQQGQCPEELDGRPTDTRGIGPKCNLLERVPRKDSLCKPERSASHAGKKSSTTDIFQGKSSAVEKRSNADNRDVNPCSSTIAGENGNKREPSEGDLMSYQVANAKETSANCSAAEEGTLSSVGIFHDLNTSLAADVDQKTCPRLRGTSEEVTERDCFIAEAVSPLPTLLASAVVEKLAVAKIQTLQQQSMFSNTFPCAGKPGIQAADLSRECENATQGGVCTNQKKTASSQLQRHGHVLEAPNPEHHDLVDAAVVRSVHTIQSSSPASTPSLKADNAAYKKQEDNFEETTYQVIENSTAIGDSPELDDGPSANTSAAPSPSFARSQPTIAFPEKSFVETDYAKMKSEGGKIKGANVVDTISPPQLLVSGGGRNPSTSKRLAAETLRRKGEKANIVHRAAIARKVVLASERFGTEMHPSAARMSTESLKKPMGTDTWSVTAPPKGAAAQVEATETLLTEPSENGSGRTAHVATNVSTTTETIAEELDGRRATEKKVGLHTPTAYKCCAAHIAAPKVRLQMEPGLQHFAETAAPRSRLHLHCMLYEVVAIGCEKRGRAWARGEDLIELEEEVRQKEAATAQLHCLQQLRKRQQQEFFHQMVRRKAQLVEQSHRIGKQMHEKQGKKRSEICPVKTSAPALWKTQLSEDAKKGGMHFLETKYATIISSRHTSVNSATLTCQGHGEFTPQQNDKAGNEPSTNQEKAPSTCQNVGDDTELSSASKRLHAEPAEERKGFAEDRDCSSGYVQRSEEERKTKDTTNVEATTDLAFSPKRPACQTVDIAPIISSAAPQRQHKLAKLLLARETATLDSSGKSDAGSFRSCSLRCKCEKPSLCSEAVHNCISKGEKLKCDFVLTQQQGEDSISSSDDGTSSTGPLLSPIGHLLEEGIKVLMDERLVRRRLKKKAKKEKKKRKKMKLRALEMQEREQRRLLCLVDQLVELPEESAVSQATIQALHDIANIPNCNATSPSDVKAARDLEGIPQEESVCTLPSSYACVSSKAASSRKSTEASSVRHPSSKAVLSNPSCDMMLDTSQPQQNHAPFEADFPTASSQSDALQCGRAFAAVDQFSLRRENATEREFLIRTHCEKIAPSPSTSDSLCAFGLIGRSA